MAAEAEAAREARAKVIAAEGEQKASRALREASEVIGASPAALQLRYLQVSSHLACLIAPFWLVKRQINIAKVFVWQIFEKYICYFPFLSRPFFVLFSFTDTKSNFG